MTKNFHESYTAAEEIPAPEPRATGIVFAVVFLILAVLFRNTLWVGVPALIGSAGFGLTAWRRPTVLEPLNQVWFQFSLLLHKIMSPVIMFVLFALVITPYGLLMQLFRDPLRKHARGKVDSYWIERSADPQPDMRQQF